MKAAVYLRVSTDRQDEANQEPECLRLVEARGWEPLIVRETASGAKTRPEWDWVLELARRGDVHAVVIWSLDRIGRRMFELIADVRELDRVGCSILSVREPWLDTSGPTRNLLLSIMGWVAQHERERLVERTKAGLARARAAGKVLGRPERRLSDKALALAKRLRLDGRSWRATATELRRLELGDFDAAIVRRAVLKGSAVGPN